MPDGPGRAGTGRGLSRLLVLGAAVLFSTGGAAIKACAVGGWQVASFRSAVATVALLAMVPAARRGWTRRTLLVAVPYAATLVLYTLANRLTTAASTIFLQDTAPLYVLLLSPFLLGERFHRRDLWPAFLAAAGMALFFVGVPDASATAPRPLAGNVLAALAGVTWALTLLGLRWVGREGAGAGAAATAAGNPLAALSALGPALPVRDLRPADVAVVLFLGVFQIGLAYALLTRGMAGGEAGGGVPAFEASLLLLLEPVLNPAWAFLVHGERPGGLVLLGGALVLAATAWISARDGGSP